MKLTKSIRGGIAALVCSGMLSAQIAQAGPIEAAPHLRQTAPAGSGIRDVALQDQGVLRGQIVDAQGLAQSAVPVLITRNGHELARTETDASGRFSVSGLTGGVYELHTPNGTAIYRAWTPGTAPPAAAAEATLIPDQTLVRGQMRGGHILGWLANPWVLAGIVAAAIAIPLALDDDDAS